MNENTDLKDLYALFDNFLKNNEEVEPVKFKEFIKLAYRNGRSSAIRLLETELKLK